MPGIIALNTLRGCAHDDDPYSKVNLCDYTVSFSLTGSSAAHFSSISIAHVRKPG